MVIAALAAAPPATAVPTFAVKKGTIALPIRCNVSGAVQNDPNAIYSSLCRGRVTLTIGAGSAGRRRIGTGGFSLGGDVSGKSTIKLTKDVPALLRFYASVTADVRIRKTAGSGTPVAAHAVMLRRPAHKPSTVRG
jgi:hypothetical protein